MFKNKKMKGRKRRKSNLDFECTENESKNIRKAYLEEDNLKEDKIIKNLEKKLRLNKKSGKSVPKTFASDGLDCE